MGAIQSKICGLNAKQYYAQGAESSDKAQAKRRSLLKNKKVLLIQAGGNTKKFILERLKELEVQVTVVDDLKSIWQHECKVGLISGFIPIDVSLVNDDEFVDEALKAIKKHGVKFDACTTFYEPGVERAAKIAERLKLGMNDVEAYELARSKMETRNVMQRAGLPTPKYACIKNKADIASACVEVGFPAVLKPTKGMGSFEVSKVHSEAEVYQKFTASLEEHEKTMDSSTDDAEWNEGVRLFENEYEFILDEFLDGDEFDIDVVLSNGKKVYAKVQDNWPIFEPYFQETGTTMPSMYPLAKQKELVDLAVDTMLALGLKNGVAHVECKYLKGYETNGARLVEVNARLGGNMVSEVNRTAWGVDLIEEHIMCSLRIPVRPVVPEFPLQYISVCYLNAPYSGTLIEDNWLDEAVQGEGDVYVRYLKAKGDYIVGPESEMPERFVAIAAKSPVSHVKTFDSIKSIIDKAPKSIFAEKVAEKPYKLPSGGHPLPSIW